MRQRTQTAPRRVGLEPFGPVVPRDRQAFVGGATALMVALISTTGRAAPPEAPPPGGASSAAHSAPSRAECLDAHRAAQEFRQAGKLVEAEGQLRICASATCPGPVIADCGGWINELDEATPSMVFEVEADGKESAETKLFVDQQPVADPSHPVSVNPGRHVVRAELPPFEPHEETVFMAEGHRMRLVSIKFESPKPPAPPSVADDRSAVSAPTERRPVPIVIYPLLGVGAVGLAGFAVFGSIRRAKQTSLDRSCSPACSNSDVQAMKTNYLIGDVSLGVGVAAIVGAAVIYLVRPVERLPSPTLSLAIGPIGGVAWRNTTWGASAATSW